LASFTLIFSCTLQKSSTRFHVYIAVVRHKQRLSFFLLGNSGLESRGAAFVVLGWAICSVLLVFLPLEWQQLAAPGAAESHGNVAEVMGAALRVMGAVFLLGAGQSGLIQYSFLATKVAEKLGWQKSLSNTASG
jgi:hypothetical protein